MRAHAHMDEIPDDKIRERAHHIWEREGRPDGRDQDHWQMARTELAMEMNPGVAMEPNPAAERDVVDHPEPVEPLEAVENQGSFPGLADQDEEQQYPRRLKKARGKRGGRSDRTDLPPG
ncbi:MAG: DUF2934 domain-containing protein [Pseudomonadota bacterium]